MHEQWYFKTLKEKYYKMKYKWKNFVLNRDRK